MTIPRNLSFLAEGASSTGVLGTANGGTGQTSLSSVSVGTSTNLAGGAAGEIPFQTGSGATSFTAAGTSGQVLTSAGTGTPTWSTPSSGAMTLISTQTASNGILSWTGLSGYDKYFLLIKNVYTVGGNDNIIIQFGTGSTTWVTSGYHYTSVDNYNALNTGTAGTSYDNDNSSGITNGIVLGGSDLNSSSCYSAMNYLISNFSSTKPVLVGDFASVTSSYQRYYGINGSLISNSSLVTAIRITFASTASGITGSASLYGISS